MKVLVTGASGFIGSAALRLAAGPGRHGRRPHPRPERAREHQPERHLARLGADAGTAAARPSTGSTAVVNLLGEKIDQRWTDEAKQRILESRRTGTRNLVEAIAGLERKPAVLVSQSAIGFYGDRGEAIVDESAQPGEGFDSEVVQEWESAAREAEALGVRLVIVRTGHVLDPRDGLLAKLLPPFKLGVGGPLAGGGQYVSWIHIDDEIGILLWALDNEEVSGVINATAPNPATNRELSKALGRALGTARGRCRSPASSLDLIYGSEFGQVLRGGQRVVPRRALDLGYEFRFTDLDEALADLL